MRKQRTAARALLAICLMILLFCWGYIMLEAHHDCEGEACPVCAHIRQCADMLHAFRTDRLAVVLSAAVFVPLLMIMGWALPEERPGRSPVALQVRLND